MVLLLLVKMIVAPKPRHVPVVNHKPKHLMLGSLFLKKTVKRSVAAWQGLLSKLTGTRFAKEIKFGKVYGR